MVKIKNLKIKIMKAKKTTKAPAKRPGGGKRGC